MTLAAGSRLGPYEILSPLGAGGMGEVYRARDARLNREVAIKVLPEKLAADAAALARFEREAKAVAALSHPNILGIFDLGKDGETSYAVTELLIGETLRQRLEEGPLPQRKALEYAREIAQGLAAAHEKGIVHRDLKPENLFVTSDGRVKILDFGLAKVEGLRADETQSPTVGAATEPGTVMGTVGYMSPEQVRGKPADPRSDIFSFGAVLYEMLSGERAFRGDSAAETMAAIAQKDPPALAEPSGRFPASVERILRHCLEKRPEDRFDTAHDLAFALETAMGGSSAPRLVAPPGKRRSIWRPAAGVLAVLAALGVSLWIGRRTASPESPKFRQITFHRGYIESARFSPDEQTVFYGSTRRDEPLRIYSARLDSIESTALDLPSATVLGISRTGEMALLLGCVHRGYWIRSGTLARVPIGGGSPREILEHVTDGDISRDGQAFAVVREVGTRQRLEFPIGKVLLETDGWFSHPRISPDGKSLTFFDHPFYGNDAGYVSVARSGGPAQRVMGLSQALNGLAWSRDGKEIWFTGQKGSSSSPGNNDTRYLLWAIRPGGKARLVYGPPMNQRIHDISDKGAVLLTGDDSRGEIGGLLQGDSRDRDLSTWSDEALSALSEDGSTYVGVEQSAPGAGLDPVLYYRRSGDAAPVRLGSGSGLAISPDKRWIVAVLRTAESAKLLLVPAGAGEARPLDLGRVQPRVAIHERASWSADGKSLLFPGFEPGRRPRSWLMEIPGGHPRAITPEGDSRSFLSPDGQSVASIDEKGRILVYRVAGGDPVEVKGALPGEEPIQWEASGRALFLWDRAWPAHIGRLDLSTGERTAWKELTTDPVGAVYGNLLFTRDGKHYVYRIRRVLSELDLAEGLR
jgi:serine/threonine protein kinase/Tol biopolymer transport system component